MLKKNVSLIIIASLLLYVSGCTKSSSELEEGQGIPKPIADFTYTTGDPSSPTKVTFVNTSQHGESYYWELGAVGTSNSKTPAQTDFKNYGTYNVSLTATGPGGQTKTTKEINVSPPYKKVIIKEIVFGLTNTIVKFDSSSYPDIYVTVSGGGPLPINTKGWMQYNDWPNNENAYWAMQYGYIISDFNSLCTINFYDADDPTGGDPDDLMKTCTFLPKNYIGPTSGAFPTQIFLSTSGNPVYIIVGWE